MQSGCAERFSTPIICSRVGSARALSSSTEASTLVRGSGMDGGEHTPLTRSGSVDFIPAVYQTPLTFVYASATIPSTNVDLLKRGIWHGEHSRVGSCEVRGNGH